MTQYTNANCTVARGSQSFILGACLPNRGFYSRFLAVGNIPSNLPSIFPSAIPTIPAVVNPSISPTLALTSYSSASPLAPTTPLTGYFVVAQYSDAACLSVLYSESKKLNYCTNNLDNPNTYTMYTATASTFVGTKYSDAACSAALGSKPLSYSGGCNSKVRAFVSDTGIPQSSTFIQSLRCVTVFCLALS